MAHYRLLRRLGAGGMGEVFLAEDSRLDRQVAIKFLVGPADEHARKRLLQEARAAAALDHPAICAVYEVGSDPAGMDFIVMQYLEGESLAARLQRGRLSASEMLAIGARITEGLQAAHRRGIIHRDLKPQNVIITPSGDPKLLDFGLAKRVLSAEAAAEPATVTQLTQPYAVLGTPGYMSPEQIRSQPADYRSDLFALGCLLYEGFTGRRAFSGGTPADIAAEVLHLEPPPVSSLAPELDASYDAFIARLLKKAPQDRFQSADDALGAIRALLPSAPFTPRPSVPLTQARRGSWTRAAVIVTILAGLAAIGVWQWPRRGGLPSAPPEAATHYVRGVEALREGTYATARLSLEEAVRLYPRYVQAYSRLAEARSELDDALGANEALVRVSDLVPDPMRLSAEERLRLEAVRASVLRDHDKAIQAYRRLADLQPDEAGGWLDVGRAEEAAGQTSGAAESYAKALALDSQYAAAHFRVGTLRAQMGQRAAGLAALDEAIRLYQTSGRSEGEAESLLRKGQILTAGGKNADARDALERALQLAGDRQAFQRVRARFGLARLTAVGGNYSEAETSGRDAVREAMDAGLQAHAANGLIDLASTLMLRNQYDSADAQLVRAIEIAEKHKAKRTEMRARLQQASLRLQQNQFSEAIKLSETPLRFFSEQRFVRAEADGKNIAARAHEELENYAEASRLATDVLQLAESMRDDALVAQTLENLAGQLTNQGRLPEALGIRERIEKIHRTQNDHLSLAYDLPNRADLLIRLGRGREAEPLLQEVEQKIAAGVEAYMRRKRRVALLRALVAATECRFNAVGAFAKAAILDGPAKPGAPVPEDSTTLYARVLGDRAESALGGRRTSSAVRAQWIRDASPALQRELSYWVAQTLLARGERATAHATAVAAWSAAGAQGNHELRWRLAALAAQAANGPATSPDGVTMRTHANTDMQALTAAWPGQATTYFARPDLTALRQALAKD
ncbi:MAG TPA: protein kinase [Vicinamibacterales bacterium]|nr:protein kinase [Vicinamibacterales bacterium]